MNMDKLKMSLDEIIKMDKEKEKESKYSKPEGGSSKHALF